MHISSSSIIKIKRERERDYMYASRFKSGSVHKKILNKLKLINIISNPNQGCSSRTTSVLSAEKASLPWHNQFTNFVYSTPCPTYQTNNLYTSISRNQNSSPLLIITVE